jgi:glycosyltransferase involved in cell wall biosynthesis
MVGTRGVPARYGGFETAVEEIGTRLAARGHEVIVYCRSHGDDASAPGVHNGMILVHLPALRRKSLETLSHTACCALHSLRSRRCDVTIVFNAANSVFLPVFRVRSTGVATHVDGLEWKRSKWGTIGKRYYRLAEGLATRWSDALICDAEGIAEYYRDEFGVDGDVIAYGAPILHDVGDALLVGLGLERRRYHLIVARFEPENHVVLGIEGYRKSRAQYPLVVVGAAPYSDAYTRRIHDLVAGDRRVRLVGAVWDQALLDQLYVNAASYVHGHSVGGTNPSLLRAMGAGSPIAAFDVNFNREVLGESGQFWATARELAAAIDDVEEHPATSRLRGEGARARASARYQWDSVAVEYEQLCSRLARKEATTAQTLSFREILRR